MKELLMDLFDTLAVKYSKLLLWCMVSGGEDAHQLDAHMHVQLHARDGWSETPFLPSTIKQSSTRACFMDAITGKVHYTLNEEWLLREDIKVRPQNLNMSFQSCCCCCCMNSLSALAMDNDMLTQVKEKILEMFCKNIRVSYSQEPC